MKTREKLAEYSYKLSEFSGIVKLLLIFFIVLSSLCVVYVSHLNRLAFNQLQAELNMQNKTQEEWGQLLLQYSSLTAHRRIEDFAVNKLAMKTPLKSAVISGGHD